MSTPEKKWLSPADSAGSPKPRTPPIGTKEAAAYERKLELEAKIKLERQVKDQAKKTREDAAIEAAKERDHEREVKRKANECRREAAKIKALLEEERLLQRRVQNAHIPNAKAKGAKWEEQQEKRIKDLLKEATSLMSTIHHDAAAVKQKSTLGYVPKPAAPEEAPQAEKKGLLRKLVVLAVLVAGGVAAAKEHGRRQKEAEQERKRAAWRKKIAPTSQPAVPPKAAAAPAKKGFGFTK